MFINTKQIVYTISNTGFRNNNLSAHERKSSRRCRYRPPPLTPPPVRIRRTTFRLFLRRFSMFYFHSNGRYESANHVQPFDFRKSLVSVVAKI